MKSDVKNIFKICLISGLLLFGFELLLRLPLLVKTGTFFFKPGLYILDPWVGYKLRPNFRSHDGRITINSQGFRRNQDITYKKKEGVIRIFLMGTSVAFGYEADPFFSDYRISNEETVDHYLEEFLSKKLPQGKFEVINAGIPGWRTHQELIYLIYEVLKYNPDIILFLHGHNDHYYYYNMVGGLFDFDNDPAITSVIQMSEPLSFGKCIKNLTFFLNNHCAIYRSLEKLKMNFRKWRLKNKRQKFLRGTIVKQPLLEFNEAKLIEDYRKASRKNFLRISEIIAIILKNEGIEPIFLLEPELILDVTHKFTNEERNFKELETFLRPQNYEKMMKILAKECDSLLESFAKEHGYPWLNLQQIYESTDTGIFRLLPPYYLR